MPIEIKVLRKLRSFKADYPEEVNPVIILTSTKKACGNLIQIVRVGAEKDWRSMVSNIKEKGETFKSAKVDSGKDNIKKGGRSLPIPYIAAAIIKGNQKVYKHNNK